MENNQYAADTMAVIGTIYLLASLLALALCSVVFGVFFRQSRRGVMRLICTSGWTVLLGSGVSSYYTATIGAEIGDYLFSRAVYVDRTALGFLTVFLASWGLGMVLWASWLKGHNRLFGGAGGGGCDVDGRSGRSIEQDIPAAIGQRIPFEAAGLALCSAFGGAMLIFANDLMTAYLALEIVALTLYPIVACYSDRYQTRLFTLEGAMKYFIFNGIMSAIYLLGAALTYAATSSLNFGDLAAYFQIAQPGYLAVFGGVMILAAICGKLGAAPFHFWLPDLYQAAPSFILLLLGGGKKIAVVALLFKLFHGPLAKFHDILLTVAIFSLLVGSIGGLVQNNLRRLFAYSAVNHSGFILLAICADPAPFVTMQYVAVYAGLLALPLFAALLLLLLDPKAKYKELDDLRQLSKKEPLLAFSLVIIVVSLIGIPPFAGFAVKFDVIKAMLAAQMGWGVAVAVLSAIISSYYYLRIIVAMFFQEAPSQADAAESGGGMRDNGAAADVVGVVAAAGEVIPLLNQKVRARLLSFFLFGAVVLNSLYWFIRDLLL